MEKLEVNQAMLEACITVEDHLKYAASLIMGVVHPKLGMLVPHIAYMDEDGRGALGTSVFFANEISHDSRRTFNLRAGKTATFVAKDCGELPGNRVFAWVDYVVFCLRGVNGDKHNVRLIKFTNKTNNLVWYACEIVLFVHNDIKVVLDINLDRHTLKWLVQQERALTAVRLLGQLLHMQAQSSLTAENGASITGWLVGALTGQAVEDEFSVETPDGITIKLTNHPHMVTVSEVSSPSFPGRFPEKLLAEITDQINRI